jgi:hypothetical protein
MNARIKAWRAEDFYNRYAMAGVFVDQSFQLPSLLDIVAKVAYAEVSAPTAYSYFNSLVLTSPYHQP